MLFVVFGIFDVILSLLNDFHAPSAGLSSKFCAVTALYLFMPLLHRYLPKVQFLERVRPGFISLAHSLVSFCFPLSLLGGGVNVKMGSTFKKAIFDEHVQAGILGWREKVKRKKGMRGSTNSSTQPGSTTSTTEGSASVQLAQLTNRQNEGNGAQPIVA